MSKKQLKFAGYHQQELTDDDISQIEIASAKKDAHTLAWGFLCECSAKKFGYKIEPTEDGFKMTVFNSEDDFGDGTQVFMSAEGDDVRSSVLVMQQKLAHALKWELPRVSMAKKGKYR